RLDASCRVAFAACVHDLGKFTERARIGEAAEKDAEGNTRGEINKQLYCPQWDGRYSHVHAAYTAMAIDLMEAELPPLKGHDVSPFAAWKAGDADDSLINAAAMHHKPGTFLQWVIATADRVASGFEREAFEAYNKAEEGTETGKTHYTARQLTLFEQIRTAGEAPAARGDFHWRYPLRPLSIEALFPVAAKDYEHNDRKEAQREYRELWEGFRKALASIPESHRRNWPLWLDHFDSLWAAFTHAIPAATAGNARPEVSLYDHSRTTAALATALWRYHHDRGDDPRAVAGAMRQRSDWDQGKFLLILGDFFGIQEFIFASGGETQRNAAKLLRGRSFHVSLLTECAALRIMDALDLPPTSQVINAAGKFLVVAPDTPETRERLSSLQQEFDRWFLRHTYGESGIGIGWESACCNDFIHRAGEGEAPFKRLIDRLFRRMDEMKARRLSLCGGRPPSPLFEGFLDAFDRDKGVCAIDGRSPATLPMDGKPEKSVCPLAADQIRVGRWLGHHARLLMTRENIGHHTLGLDLFGYHVSFTGEQEASGRFGNLARDGSLLRAWDYSLPERRDQLLFAGYARRQINAYIPMLGERNAWDADRYRGIGETDDWDPRAPKSLEHIARDDLWLDENGRWMGTDALMVLKGDVDNLGSIFEKGLERPSFAKWASLSRQMNAFFSLCLPWLCHDRYPSSYTVFAGGDDFFLIGPWRSTIRLAREMRTAFTRYVTENPEIHFSTGLVMTKPGTPVRQLGECSEEALEQAKGLPGKDAMTLFGETVKWQAFDDLWKTFEQIEEKSAGFGLSTGYLYRLQQLAMMAENLRPGAPDPNPENAIWRSWFSYRTWRALERMRLTGNAQQQRRERLRRMNELAKVLAEPIERYGSRFRIPLFIHLYQQRH
ncbi:MAG TPA: type III-A CRISPR-associated protein Cas10/Csm1, partial [Sedimenticola sp.]|nr:type III-A CRISPR-associated protein Cas10/Csm1 [Sedimenticola sp.]